MEEVDCCGVLVDCCDVVVIDDCFALLGAFKVVDDIGSEHALSEYQVK